MAEFYAVGKGRGDWMSALDKIERNHEWAIMIDHDEPPISQYRLFINGVLVGSYSNQIEATNDLQKYQNGSLPVPD